MTSRVSRRTLLAKGALTAGLALARSATARATHQPESLVFVRLRGGADGLSLLVPHADAAYHRARPHTAIRYASAQELTALRLERDFALHPQLAPLRPWFASGELGAIVGVGQPDEIRTHGAARRRLDAAIVDASAGRALEAGPGLPSQHGTSWLERCRPDAGPRTLFVDLDGWDLHVAQGEASEGRLAMACSSLAKELTALRSALASEMSRVLVVVVTEFGRTLPETPLRGTDDGRASVMLVLGAPGSWGRVLGSWPGLLPQSLIDGRHVRPTADVRTVIAQLANGKVPA